MSVRVINSLLILLCAVLCTTGCYRASPPLEDDPLEQPDAVTDTTQTKPTPTPVAGPATPNNSPLIMQLGDLEIDELSTYPTLAFRIFDFDDEISCQEVIPESSNQNAIQTTAEGEPNESAMTYGDITITGGDSTKCGIAISTRYAAPDPVTISLTLSDGKGASKSYFDVTVLSTNTAPTPDGSGQVNISMQEDDSGKSILLSEFSDTTPRGSPARLAFESVTNPNKGVLGLYPSDAGTGGQSIIYTPNENENGSDSFSYKVCDNDPGVPKCSAVQTVNISIAAVNDAPVIAPIDSKTTKQNESLTFTFAISDVDNTPSCSAMSYTPDSLVSAVTFTGNGNPDCVATISPTQPGSATITFRLFDGEKTGERSFAFNVEGVNEAPTISDITNVTATEDQSFEVSFTAGDDTSLTCSSEHLSYNSNSPSKVAQTGAVSWSGTWPNCKGTVTPVSNASGTVGLDFKVTDGEYTATDSFTVTLTNVNDAPSGTVKCNSATTDIVKVGKGGQSWNFKCNNATDPDNETLTYKLIKDSETDLSGVTCADTISSSVVSATEGQFSANFASTPHSGTCTYKVKACDDAGLCTPLSSFHIEITSYQAAVSTVNKPTLSAACVASSSATFSFSGNISSINYTAKTRISNEPDPNPLPSTSTSPINFSYTLPTDFLTASRLTTDETSNTSASFSVNSGVFKNAIGGGSSISASGTSSSFKVERTLEAVSPSLATDFTTEDVSLDGYQPLFASTPSVCRQCTANRISLSAGTTHTCVTDDNTKLKCWGKNTSSQLGTGNTTEYTFPVASSISTFAALQVSSGLDFSCVYGLNSMTPEIRCAGSNSTGQLGRSGSTYNKFDSTSQKVNSPANHTPVAVAAAKFGEFACGLFNQSTGGTEKGRVYCWGKNNNGQLGNGATTTPSAGSLVGLAGAQGNSDFFALSAGENHACAIRKDSASSSKVYCWGSGSDGQLGDNPSSSSSSSPVKVHETGLGSSVVQVAVGSQHTCALTSAGQVYCWGSGELGQLGLAGTTSFTTPQHVTDTAIDGKVVQLSAGAHHTCALLNTFALYCWGFGSSGQLGLGSSTTSDGSADDCNSNSGVQNVAYCKKSPQEIEFSGSPKLMSVSAGAEHTCAVALDGKGYCWGRNVDGRLGLASKADESSPNNICSSGGATCTPLTSLRPRMCSTYSIP